MTTGFLPDRGAHRSGLSIKSTHGRFQLRSLPQKRCAATLWTARLTTIFCSTIRYLRFPCLHASAFHLLPYLSARLSYPPLPPSFFFPSFLFFSLSFLLSYRPPPISTPTRFLLPLFRLETVLIFSFSPLRARFLPINLYATLTRPLDRESWVLIVLLFPFLSFSLFLSRRSRDDSPFQTFANASNSENVWKCRISNKKILSRPNC